MKYTPLLSRYSLLLGLLLTPWTWVYAQNQAQDDAESEEKNLYAQRDTKLNETYQKLMQELPADDQDRLRSAQRIWIDYINSKCRSAQSVSFLICKSEETKIRTDTLLDYLNAVTPHP